MSDRKVGVRQAVIMAGGEGTRLKPLTNTRPKPLLPVLGRPCIEYVINSLASAGVEEIFIACGYRSQDIVKSLGETTRSGAKIVYAYEETPMGTAGAVKLLQDRIHGTFIVGSGDTITDADLGRLIDLHMEKKALVTMALTEVERPEQFGIVGVNADGRIERFKEKPKPEEVFSNVINAGTYVLEPEVLDHVPTATKYDFSKNLFPDLLQQGKVLCASRLNGYWKDIGRPKDLFRANIDLAERHGQNITIRGALCKGKIFGSGFNAEGARIYGPVYVGERTRLGRGTSVTRSAIGKESTLGEKVSVEDSLLLDRCQIGAGAILRGSILGEGCIIGPGVSLVDSVLGDGVKLEGPASLEGRSLPDIQ
ncbi:MAG TPA: NDP-sugar synthase [Methanomassiliicoccales archaeon]